MTAAADIAAAVRHALRRTVMHVVEPIKGPWVNNNFWGDQRTQALPSNPNQVVQVLPKNTHMYGPPAVHSVNLSRSDAVLAQNGDVRARVTYGCGGIENEFFCDWLHGLQFTLVCNSVTVSAMTYAPIGFVPYSADQTEVFLGVMVAKGTVARGAPITLTESTLRLGASPAADATEAFAVPDLAREVTVHIHVTGGPLEGNSNPAVSTGVRLVFFNEGGSQIAFYDAQVCAGGRKIPIPGGANTLSVVNTNGGVGTALCTVEWFLGL